MTLRTAFMGSPAVAMPALEAVYQHSALQLVVTQPDRPAGRGRRLTAPPVKALAESWGLPIEQPVKMRDGTLASRLRALNLDLVVVVAFGRILPPDVLTCPRHGCINLHFSLLPRWRGAAPVQRAVLAGDSVTGVSIMAMDEGLDTGPIYGQARISIGELETAGELASRLARLGADQIGEFLQRFPAVPGPIPQDSEYVTMAPPLRKDEGRVDWRLPMASVLNLIRGLDPWPVAFTMRRGARLKLFAARPDSRPSTLPPPGEVLSVDAEGMHVACGNGILVVGEVQPADRKRMSAKAYHSGAPFEPLERLE